MRELAEPYSQRQGEAMPLVRKEEEEGGLDPRRLLCINTDPVSGRVLRPRPQNSRYGPCSWASMTIRLSPLWAPVCVRRNWA